MPTSAAHRMVEEAAAANRLGVTVSRTTNGMRPRGGWERTEKANIDVVRRFSV